MIGRAAGNLVAALVGIVAGAALVLAATSAPGATTSGRAAVSDQATPTTLPTQALDSAADVELPETAGALLLAWTTGGLPVGFTAGVEQIDGVMQVTEIAGGRLDLTASRDSAGTVVDRTASGWAIPLDAIAVDPATFAAFVPTGQRGALGRLEPGAVILGETSAALRRLEVGGQLTLGQGEDHTVVGILDDDAVGAAEIVVHRADVLAAGLTPRYLLLQHDRQRPAIEAALRDVAGDRPLRVRAPGETPYLRHGDAVLPQAILKDRYGEFSYRPPAPGELAFEVDPVWMQEHLVTRQVPILGSVTCHRASAPSADAVLTSLDRRGLAHTVDISGFEGCWNPRLISAGGDLSRHSWGVAIDLNADGNPTGTGSGQPDALVEAFTAAGWGWGGTWLVPDPMHFELVDDPYAPIKVRP